MCDYLLLSPQTCQPLSPDSKSFGVAVNRQKSLHYYCISALLLGSIDTRGIYPVTLHFQLFIHSTYTVS